MNAENAPTPQPEGLGVGAMDDAGWGMRFRRAAKSTVTVRVPITVDRDVWEDGYGERSAAEIRADVRAVVTKLAREHLSGEGVLPAP